MRGGVVVGGHEAYVGQGGPLSGPNQLMVGKRVAISRRIAEYIGTLDLVGGDKDGECFVVLPWERRFIYGAWSGPGDAALSVGAR